MKQSLSWALLALPMLAGACDSKPAPTAVFVFNRPEHLELVCLNRAGDDDPFATKNPLVVPLRCCSGSTPLAPKAFFASDKEREELCGEERNAPVLHALVTQSVRGEVAAVDLANAKVIDSNRRIPGATFVDVGGLPRAIITPREIETEEGRTVGSPWTFVISGEDYNVRAIATCRFVFADGVACGPELLDEELEGLDAEGLRSVLEIPLPSTPADMVYLDGALWVTLPALSAIARIDLAPQEEGLNGHPFVEQGGRAGPATFFEIPSVEDVDPGEPIREEDPYLAVCGLGYKADVSQPLELPATPLPMSRGASAPQRLRIDAASGLLLVGDRGQPVIHALAIENGVPVRRGLVRTGAPVRDFAVTDPVPLTAPTFDELVPGEARPTYENEDLMVSTGRPEFTTSSSRYLYAIDERDGSVLGLLFGVAEDTGEVFSSLLEAPQRFATGSRDRINVAGVANALDIIDTRALTGDYVCNPADEEGLDTLIARIEKKEAAASGAKERELERKLETLEAAREIASETGSGALNGVFLAVVDTLGALTIIDIHDANMFCRAGDWCTGSGADEINRSNAAGEDPLAVQRHAVRRAGVDAIEVAATNDKALAELECPSGTFAALKDSAGDKPTLVCTSADPWTSFTTSFEVAYEGVLARTLATSLERDEEGRLVLRASPGLDLCALGIVPDVLDGEDDGYLGDWVVADGTPSPGLKACSAPAENREPRMRVLQAFADRLILEEPVIPASTRGGEATPYDPDKLLECFPTSMPVTWRVNDRYRVSWANVALHRMVASESDGSCIEDETKDERLRSRTAPGEAFQNPYIAFRLRELETDSLPSSLDTVIQVGGGSAGVALPVYVGSPGVESLPVSVRYLDVTGELFVVDTTSQGLRRFYVNPLRSDGKYYR